MTTAPTEFKPNYVVPPGEILEETLEARGLGKAQFAERCGRCPKTISQIIAGTAPITPETAIAFERVLGVRASLWNSLESRYRLQLAEREEQRRLESHVEWVKRFPLRKMMRFGLIEKRAEPELVGQVLDYFGVSSVETWERLVLKERQAFAFRASASFQSNPYAVAAWLRWGEKTAEAIDCAPYDKDAFKAALSEIRGLTRLPPQDFQTRLRELCRTSGVVVLWHPELDGTRLSGATRWLTKDKVLIQLSLRHKTDDHFWFSFFHEAGHVFLHGKKQIFIDEANNTETPEEKQANDFAQRTLIPIRQWDSFVADGKGRFSEATVVGFAERIGIAPGIVVGQLQHAGLLPYSHLNGLKHTLTWTDGAT